MKRFFLIVSLYFMISHIPAQVPGPFYADKKWGYRLYGEVIITPQYDTAFAFDQQGMIAMAGNRNKAHTAIHPLTGEESPQMDYYFIDRNNRRITLKTEAGKDSTSVFPDQQELVMNYQNTLPVFKVLFNKKVWLFNKEGRQLSEGFDDLFPAETDGFYITETYTEWDKEVVRLKGLLDQEGQTIVPCTKKHIHINAEDSLVYACSAIFNRRLSDEVFDYRGKLVYSNKNHIAFASKRVYVYKLYDPKEVFVFVNQAGKDLYSIEGERFYYLKQNKALVVNKDTWLLVNLQTRKKQKVNNSACLGLIYTLMEL